MQAVRNDLSNYDSNRVSLPESWAGHREAELERISGIQGAIFSARGGWFAVARTKEAVLAMAKLALQKAKNPVN